MMQPETGSPPSVITWNFWQHALLCSEVKALSELFPKTRAKKIKNENKNNDRFISPSFNIVYKHLNYRIFDR
jgi:hypothetical protein